MNSRITSLFTIAIMSSLFVITPAFGQGLTKEEIKQQWNRAIALRKQGSYVEALNLYEKLAPTVDAAYGQESPTSASISHALADLYRVQSQHAKAELLYKRALSIREGKLGKDHVLVASSLNGMGTLYRVMGEYAKAEPLFHRSLSIREAKLGKDHLDVAASLNNLANLYVATGQPRRAESLFLRSLQINEAKLGKDHATVATPLNNLADLYQAMGLYAKAEPLLERALSLREQKLGKGHALVASSLNSLANLYSATGEHARAEPLYLRSLRIDEARYGENHPEVALALSNLAVLYTRMGRYTHAEPLFLRSLSIREAKLGKDHPMVALSLMQVANSHRNLGQHTKVEALFLRSLKIYETKLGKDHPKVAGPLSSLADWYRTKGDPAKAEPLLLRSLAIREAKLGANHPDVAQSLGHQALLYIDLKQYEKAEPILLRSLSIREATFGKDHPEVAVPLNNLALLYEIMGRSAAAEPLYERSLHIREAKLSRNHPQVALALHNLAWNSASQNEWTRAVEQVHRARHGMANHLAETLPVLDEREKLTLLKATYQRSFHRALSLGWNAPREASAASAEWLLNGKAVVHQSLAEQHIQARSTKNPKARELAEALQQTHARMANLVNRLPQPGEELEYKKELQELKVRAPKLAHDLARAIGRPYRANPWVTLDELQARLSPKTAFVDIARFPVYDFTTDKSKGMRYVAWITPPRGRGPVQVVDLGEAKSIDKLIETTRTALVDSAKSITKVGDVEASQALRQPLWTLSERVLHKLMPALKEYDEWIVCPDGALWLTPWSALILPDGKYAVEQYLIRHVVTGRDLVFGLPAAKAESAYIFADPDYDQSPTKSTASLGGLRGLDDTHTDRNDGQLATRSFSLLPKVARLPGTAVEAEAVRVNVRQWLGHEPKMFLQGRASETSLKAVKNPRMLTLATHGYFLPAQKPDLKDRPGFELGEDRQTSVLRDKAGQMIENPLLRCGLLLAGCNKLSDGRGNQDDGILTGLEIISMDLNGCELVVLSACDTGLGDVRDGEGVAGLRQAFQMAGAKGVLASLWQVPDRETSLLMNAFYGELAKGRSQAQALRQAQLQRIASRRDGFGAAHPFFWSAFALTSRGAN